ncbi:MAG: FtsX-like permease family protein [Verrucomicrobia bacterium]|nr:FtsX-like permease family protein [Verrucomicrobiota bacterium]MBS0647266.1 FtsX-like permease family protein [Verrucomicrobiota bacterium]
MRFTVSVALKYLVPKWRQLSVSIISLVSVIMISLVVWLTIVFLSVSHGVKNKWVSQLLALNAPIRVTPTDAYYQSYYYKVDSLSSTSFYTTRSLGEKLQADQSDPYDPLVDAELPLYFPLADRHSDGALKDIVKESWQIIQNLPGVTVREYETALGNLRLNLIREVPGEGVEETCLSQLSYFTNVDPENKSFSNLILPPSLEDLTKLLSSLPQQALFSFFDYLNVNQVTTKSYESPLLPSLYPDQGVLKGCGILIDGELIKVVVPQKEAGLPALKLHYESKGYSVVETSLSFKDETLQEDYPYVTLEGGMPWKASVLKKSLPSAISYQDVLLKLTTTIQGLNFEGTAPLRYFDVTQTKIVKDSPFWAYEGSIPVNGLLGDGVVISKNYRENGVRIGDTGYLSYMATTSSSTQEQRLPIYVAGFYDPGLIALGHKCVFVDPKVTTSLRGSLSITDRNLGNGLNVWLKDSGQAKVIASQIRQQLEKAALAPYWEVQSYHDYDFVKPILQQLESDQTLFTLIAIIILLVACSNIISMLILLVNDKRKEIGILLAMGATKRQIGSIFGLCGCLTGILSGFIGITIAIFTLRHIEALVNLLNKLQGHDVFQSAFYGASLPSEISWSAICIVLVTTIILSLIAGLVPALKAAAVKPTETLRAD